MILLHAVDPLCQILRLFTFIKSPIVREGDLYLCLLRIQK